MVLNRSRGGLRDVMDAIPALKAVAWNGEVRILVEAILGSKAFPVRATLFDKTDGANWKVPWHQDLTIAVQERRDTDGYGPWSIKQGVQHVQPPTSVLNRMVTVRIHLDPCPAGNGALRVMPGTHQLGRLNQNHVAGFVNEKLAVTCEAEAGEALIMRPLLLPMHRRQACSPPTGECSILTLPPILSTTGFPGARATRLRSDDHGHKLWS